MRFCVATCRLRLAIARILRTPLRLKASRRGLAFCRYGFRLQENFMRLYSQKDVDKKALRGARIAILGYGSQGRAHALNLHDSGVDVVVGTRKGYSWQKAKKDGLHVMEPKEAIKGAKLVAMLVPDMTQKALYEELKADFEKGSTLLFAHGFNVHFKKIKPRKDLER